MESLGLLYNLLNLVQIAFWSCVPLWSLCTVYTVPLFPALLTPLSELNLK